MNQTFTTFLDFKKRYPIRPNDEGALLGVGTYGRVIKVEDQLETEWVAIKISEFKGHDTKSLKAEVELAQRVPRQTNIARYDSCHRLETDTSVSDFAIMKYYPDGNLADLLRRVTLTPTQIYEITKGILLGLQHLHRHRIVHRDFKPANILISRDNAGRFIPKIADFGLSKLVSDDELDSSDFDLSDGRGTPSYKAPEQIEGSRVSFNLDLWAFGVILYEMMTGEKPFRADLRNSSEQSVRREVEKKIMTVELPARLSQIAEPYGTMIRRCLVRDIHERVRKEDELLDLLDQIPQLLNQANILFEHADYQQAIAVLEQILAKREHHVDAQNRLNQCTNALQQEQLTQLLNEANILCRQQRFDQAKSQYEQVLKLNPTDETAIQGLALCIEQLRPKPVAIESELTDVYEEEKTDVYVAPPSPSPTVAKPAVLVTPSPISAPVQVKGQTVSKPTLPQSTSNPIGQAFPWKIAAPAAIVVAGIGLYMSLYSTSTSTPSNGQQPDSILSLPVLPKTKSISPEAIKSIPDESKADLRKRIDVALGKAHQAYKAKDYNLALVLTNSALQLDPTRQDVTKLRDAAQKEIQKQAPREEQPVNATPEQPKNTTPTPEVEKPKPAEPEEGANDKRLKEKQEQQTKYDDLIEEGVKAIANGNNKTKAISSFGKAQELAKGQELSTAKAEAAYAQYMAKANKIFSTDEFDGAKAWYQVAQALKDTDEVRRKIKQCTNQ
ncbi:serine/threonine-protein kinase [Spirosoma foliorum]|uniref:Protein kinase n=1 Tax=Spirosoma foliorum TaxID=2710596 RepID=A0A7G5GMW4_9BACT|nr:serine/threonine-protein kinase [Spirosoma foliorum]QMW00206.1 protein kinase [Spirosoma foliorum]